MVTTDADPSGELLVNVVGGNGLSWNYSTSLAMTLLAYPAESPFDGTWQEYCQGTSAQAEDGGLLLQCSFTAGADGAAWLRAFNSTLGLGYVNGTLDAFLAQGWDHSPYFDESIKTMFDATADD